MIPANAVPVTIAGVRYESQSAAARALGVSQAAVWRALEAGDPDRLVRHLCPHCGKPVRARTPA